MGWVEESERREERIREENKRKKSRKEETTGIGGDHPGLGFCFQVGVLLPCLIHFPSSTLGTEKKDTMREGQNRKGKREKKEPRKRVPAERRKERTHLLTT